VVAVVRVQQQAQVLAVAEAVVMAALRGVMQVQMELQILVAAVVEDQLAARHLLDGLAAQAAQA
jgi:hypothetical protein